MTDIHCTRKGVLEAYLVLHSDGQYRIAVGHLGMAMILQVLDDHVTGDRPIECFSHRLTSKRPHKHVGKQAFCLREELQNCNLHQSNFSTVQQVEQPQPGLASLVTG